MALATVASAGVIAPATVVARAPAFDSAVIKSDRLGGNFAYSVSENHAYAAHTPIVQHVATPVAVSYSAPAVTYAAAAPAVTYAAAPAYRHVAAAPAITYAAAPAYHHYAGVPAVYAAAAPAVVKA